MEAMTALEAVEKYDGEILGSWHDGKAIKLKRSYGGPDFPEGLSAGAWYVPADCPDGIADWREITGSYRYDERERRAVVYGELQERTGFRTGDSTIPLSVACDGQKAIAAYLWAVRKWEKPEIANKLNKAESTISQYISDYKAGRTD